MRPSFAQFGAELHDLLLGSLKCSLGALSADLRFFELNPGKNALFLEFRSSVKDETRFLDYCFGLPHDSGVFDDYVVASLVRYAQLGPGLIHQSIRLSNPEFVVGRIDFGQHFVGFDQAAEIDVKLNHAPRSLHADCGLLLGQQFP